MRRLGDILIEQGVLTGDQLESAFATKPSGFMLGAQVARLIPEDFANLHEACAINITGRNMTLAMVAPDDIETIAEARNASSLSR